MSHAILKRVECITAIVPIVTLGLFLGIPAPSRGDVVVESPGALVAGKTIAGWSTNWWRWAAALSPPGDPFTDSTGAFAGVNQSGPVFLLAGSPGGSNRRSFQVPTGTYILVPLVVSEYSQLELGFGQTPAQIRQAAQQQADHIDSLHAVLDGVTISQETLFTHREVSPDFNFFAVFNNQVGIFGFGDSGIAVADGYFLMIRPPEPGVHTLNYGGGASVFGVNVDETDTITVGGPSIVVQPTNQTVVVGDRVTIAVGAGGGSPLSYQWYYSPVVLQTNGPYGAALSNANTNVLTFTAGPSSAGVYWVMITNVVGRVDSSPAVLTVLFLPPTIVKQPVDQAVFTGSNAVFSVSATTTNPPLTFQWQFNGTNLFQATSDTLIITNAQIANIGEYRVVVSNGLAFTNSAVAHLALLDRPPFIVAQPSPQLVAPGSNAIFTVNAGGGTPLSYQWFFEQRGISGATADTLVLSNVQFAQAGNYTAVITNNYGAVTSSPANLFLGWSQTHKEHADQQDTAQAVKVDSSGNVLVTGYTAGPHGFDCYTAKYDAAYGTLLWERYFTNATPAALAVDRNGDVIVTGQADPFGTATADYLTVKYAGADGALLWERRYNGPSNGTDSGVAVAADSSNNIIVAGFSGTPSGMQAPSVTIKYSANGTGVWTNTGSPQGVVIQALALDPAGNVIVTGYSWNGSNDDCYIAKYAGKDGTMLWENRYAGPGDSADRFSAVAVDSDGNVVAAGNSGIFPNNNYHTVKYAGTNGAVLWEKTYNGPGNYDDTARTLTVDTAGNVLVTGGSYGQTSDFYTVKYGAEIGAPIWAKRYDGPSHDYDSASAIALDASGNAIVTGISYNTNSYTFDSYTVAYNSLDGSVLWEYQRDSSAFVALTVDAHDNVILAGNTGIPPSIYSLIAKIFANRTEPPLYRFNSIIYTNGNLQLDWTPGSGLELQFSPSLTSPDWQTVSGSASTNRMPVPATGACGYFRLFKP